MPDRSAEACGKKFLYLEDKTNDALETLNLKRWGVIGVAMSAFTIACTLLAHWAGETGNLTLVRLLAGVPVVAMVCLYVFGFIHMYRRAKGSLPRWIAQALVGQNMTLSVLCQPRLDQGTLVIETTEGALRLHSNDVEDITVRMGMILLKLVPTERIPKTQLILKGINIPQREVEQLASETRAKLKYATDPSASMLPPLFSSVTTFTSRGIRRAAAVIAALALGFVAPLSFVSFDGTPKPIATVVIAPVFAFFFGLSFLLLFWATPHLVRSGRRSNARRWGVSLPDDSSR